MIAEQRNDFRDITGTVGRGTIGRIICRRSAVIATRSDTRHRGKNSPLLLAALLLCSGCNDARARGNQCTSETVRVFRTVKDNGFDRYVTQEVPCIICNDVPVSCDWSKP